MEQLKLETLESGEYALGDVVFISIAYDSDEATIIAKAGCYSKVRSRLKKFFKQYWVANYCIKGKILEVKNA